MKISKQDYPLIATLFRLGFSNKDIAVRYGVNSSYLSSIKPKILGEDSVGEVGDVLGFSKVRLVELSLKGNKGDTVKLQATKALADMHVDTSGTTTKTKSTTTIVEEIVKELGDD